MEKSSLRKIVNVLVWMGGINVVCLSISGVFIATASTAVVSGHQVSSSDIEIFARSYVQFTFNTNIVITILALVSMAFFLGFVFYKNQKNKPAK